MPSKGRPLIERGIVQCAACGKDIERRKTDLARNTSGRFFCNNDCLSKVGRKPRRRAMRTCEWCEKEFYPSYDEWARFCSKDCHNKWQGRNRVTWACEICGTDFSLSPSQAEYVRDGRYHRKGRFCSRACMGVGAIKRPLDRTHNGKPAVLDSNGYVKVFEPGHHGAYTGWSSWMPEHRLVAEQALGRQLGPNDHVHHINGDKADNRPENLAVMGHGEHSSITSLANWDKMREWEEYRRRYGPLET